MHAHCILLSRILLMWTSFTSVLFSFTSQMALRRNSFCKSKYKNIVYVYVPPLVNEAALRIGVEFWGSPLRVSVPVAWKGTKHFYPKANACHVDKLHNFLQKSSFHIFTVQKCAFCNDSISQNGKCWINFFLYLHFSPENFPLPTLVLNLWWT